MRPSIALIAPRSHRKSQAASVMTGQQVKSGERGVLSVATQLS